jgi:TPR repeat protein
MRHHRKPTRALEAAKFRDYIGSRAEHAKTLVVDVPTTVMNGSLHQWPIQGRGGIVGVERGVLEPCVLGAAELCNAVRPLTRACERHDARACLAAGQFLTDAPPYPLAASVYFLNACLIGDAEGCERIYESDEEPKRSCDSDPFACGRHAMATLDRGLLDEACSAGVADACSMMLRFTRDDPDTSRAYLEAACQLGMPMACEEVGRSLSPGCVVGDFQYCYSPDLAEAQAAYKMACEAGWASACKALAL